VAAFESAQARNATVDLADFLPPRDHPLFLAVLTELIRVDLEFGWDYSSPQRLDDYLARFPEAFRDQSAAEAIAFEECRLRKMAGKDPAPGKHRCLWATEPATSPQVKGPPAREAAVRVWTDVMGHAPDHAPSNDAQSLHLSPQSQPEGSSGRAAE
jgi:hypothetical protein